MRKIITGAITVLLVLAMVAVLVAGCGTAAQGTAKAAAPSTPQDILNNAVSAATPMPNATGTFDLNVTVNGDQTKMPAETKAMLAQPITISGTMSASEKPMAADIAIKASLAGQQIPVGFRITGGKAWIQFMGTWYEAPAELMTAMSAASTTSSTDQAALLQQLKAAGFDPSTWITGLTTVGEEQVDGVKAYHNSGTVDMAKLVADGMKLSQDKSLQSLIPGMSSLGGTDTSVSLPSGTELSTIENEIGTMFKNITIDMWISKDGYQMRKATLSAQIVPPASQDAQGITDITIKATITMTPAKDAVTVAAPTGAKPWSDLQQALGGLEQMFGGALGGTTDTSVPEATDTTVPAATDTTVQ